MSDRYFVDKPIDSLGRVMLAGPEAHHLIHVLRAVPGMRVVLFDGSGAEFPAVVQKVGRSEIELLANSRELIDRELPFDLTLGVALPKGERQKWLVEKAVEMGVTRIVPLRTQRGVAQPVEQALSRLRRAVIEASKQCGRNRLLQMDEPQNWPDFVENWPSTASRLLAHPARENVDQSRPVVTELRSMRAVLAIGPEGGFTSEETALAVTAGWHTIDLGPRTLRVETAALVLVAMLVPRMAF